MHVLEVEPHMRATRFVVRSVRPGTYSDADGIDTVHISHDGIVLEQLEVGAKLYYWTGKRFASLIVSR
jgi:hypothetical protein